MEVFGRGTETYFFINGLTTSRDIQLSNNRTLIPVRCKLPIDTVSKSVKKDVTFATIILLSNTITSQLKIIESDPKSLAISAWNAQWDVILLNAIFNCEAMCNLQCTHSIEAISNESVFDVTNYHMYGLFKEPYVITNEDIIWLNNFFKNTDSLIDNDSFRTAVHSMASYRWHTMHRVQLAVLWAGIESLFGINSELSFRISLYISNFLSGDNKIKAKAMFDDTKNLYNARSSAVHGSHIRGDTDLLVKKSAILLNNLIVKIIEDNEMPILDKLIF